MADFTYHIGVRKHPAWNPDNLRDIRSNARVGILQQVRLLRAPFQLLRVSARAFLFYVMPKPNSFYTCEVCGKQVAKYIIPIAKKKWPPRFCDRTCAGKWRTGENHPRYMEQKKQYVHVRSPNVSYQCANCGKPVQTYRSPSAQDKHGSKYCSVQCTGEAQRAENNPSWTGGRHYLNTGYVVVHAPTHPHVDVRGYVLEHRLVMEKKIGRFLAPEEVVHHINEIKDDNRPENLALFHSQSEHAKHHRDNDTRA